MEFPDFPDFDQKPFKTVIHQEMGKHDVVELTFNIPDKFYTEVFSTGTPVKITWNNEKYIGKFYGYLSTVKSTTQKTTLNPIVMTCIGATFPLKRRGSKIWKNKTAPQIVKDIAKTFKLVAKVKDTKVKYNQQSLVGHTYWQKLNELARREGYALHAVNTTLYFKPIDEMIQEFSTSIPILEFSERWIEELLGESSQLDLFHSTIGDYVETGVHKKTSKLVAGVNPITGKPYKKVTNPKSTGKSIRKKNQEPLFEENDPWTVVESDAMSTHLSKGRANLGRLNIPGKGIAHGDPRIAPWRTIEILGTGAATDGFWLVNSATHKIFADSRYQVEFTCLTDGTGFNSTGTMRPTTGTENDSRNIKQEVISGNTKPPKTVLSGKGSMIKQSSNGFNIVPRRWEGKGN